MKIDKQTIEDLEEEIQYSSVTSLRESLLGVVKHLRKNPAKRYFITKHGQPQAVLMSFSTYTLLKKTMNQALEHAAEKNQEEKLSDAFARLRAERPHGAALEPQPEVTHVTPQATNEEVDFRPEDAFKEWAKVRTAYERLLHEKSKIIAGRVGHVAAYTPPDAAFLREFTIALRGNLRRLDSFLEKEKQTRKKQQVRHVPPIEYEKI